MTRQGEKVTKGHGATNNVRAAFSVSPLPPFTPSPLPLRGRTRRAFTLPEVLISLVLVGVVLPAVMKGLSAAMTASDDARKRVEAVGLAESKLGELTASITASNPTGNSSGDFGADHPAFRWTSTATAYDTTLTELHVRVSWTARGAERFVDLAGFAYIGAGSTGSMTTSTPTPGGT